MSLSTDLQLACLAMLALSELPDVTKAMRDRA
jgi:hypothetical protein